MQRRRKATFCHYGPAPVKLFFALRLQSRRYRHSDGLAASRTTEDWHDLRARVASDARRRIRRRVSDADNFIPVVRPGESVPVADRSFPSPSTSL